MGRVRQTKRVNVARVKRGQHSRQAKQKRRDRQRKEGSEGRGGAELVSLSVKQNCAKINEATRGSNKNQAGKFMPGQQERQAEGKMKRGRWRREREEKKRERRGKKRQRATLLMVNNII